MCVKSMSQNRNSCRIKQSDNPVNEEALREDLKSVYALNKPKF